MFLTYDTVEAFAVKRNPAMSFPFLKENGELLSISVNAGALIEPRALDLYMDFYRNAYKLTESYPQYYRFTLGMILDLENGGLIGNEGAKIADYVLRENLVMFDTSDVRKLETLSMLAQVSDLSCAHQSLYSEIVSRVDGFIQNPAWYTKFNKPLFYDLTHIIFFLTDYGTKPIPLKSDPYPCLMHMGLLALLDNDADLLSEVCLCLDYIGRDIPQYWDDFLMNSTNDINVTYGETISSALNPSVDEYHLYLVLNGYLAARKRPVFEDKFKARTPCFSLTGPAQSVLSKLSDFSHEQRFQPQKISYSLEYFTAALPENDIHHWQHSMASSALSENLVHAFSGVP